MLKPTCLQVGWQRWTGQFKASGSYDWPFQIGQTASNGETGGITNRGLTSKRFYSFFLLTFTALAHPCFSCCLKACISTQVCPHLLYSSARAHSLRVQTLHSWINSRHCMFSNQLCSSHNTHRGSKHSCADYLIPY